MEDVSLSKPLVPMMVSESIEEPVSNLWIQLTNDCHGISLVNPPPGTVLENLFIDCSRVSPRFNAHGIRVEGECSNLTLRNITVVGSSHYGFGFQRVTGSGVYLEHCHAVGCEGDGFDFKVFSEGQFAQLLCCVASRCPVGFDIRGQINVIGNTYECKVPIRYRNEPEGSVNGLPGTGRHTIGWRWKKNVKVPRGYRSSQIEGTTFRIFSQENY